jgi:aspartate/methionine/tyrosine aminotransferase
MLSERVNRIALSPTLRINARATQMRAQGVDVVDFSVGEPDFPTPEPVKRAGKAAIDADFTKYTANDGIPELKKAICAKLERENGLRFSPDEVIVSAGAKNSLFNLAMALFEEGDDILIPAPYWVSYPDQVRLAKANPVFVPTQEEAGFKLQARDLAAAITPNTKALILNYPCNPTGATYTREELEALAEVCVREQILVIADEIYEKLIYDGQRYTSIGSLNEKIRKLTIVVNGFSKAFSMTGWRLGYAAGAREVIAACSKVQSHNTSNATSFVQKAAVVALEQCGMEVERMRQEFERRRSAIVYRLRALPNVSCFSPSGAFYVMPNVRRYLDREFGGAPIRNTYGLAYYLLKEAHVAVVPGEAFGTDEHVRISFATSMERIEEGVRRIREALARLEEPRRLRPRVLNNVVTKVSDYAETRALVGIEARNAVLAEAQKHLPADAYFEWNAAIAGIVVQLRTSSPHLADFYQENFYPAPLEGDLEPHAVIYSVKDVPGRDPSGMISLESSTGFAFNTAFYGQVRSLALQLAGEAAARSSGAFVAHCAALDVNGAGVLLWGGPGSGRTGLLAAALRQDDVRLVASDAVLVRLAAAPVADLMERKLYLKAKWLGKFPEIEKLLDRSKLENMVTARDGCHVDHPNDECPLDRGAAVCLEASKKGRIILDPYWLGGGQRHVRRTAPRLAVLLAKDPVLPMVQKLDARAASRLVSSGQFPGASGTAFPFANPHLAGLDATHSDMLRNQHERLFAATEAVVLNLAIGSAESAAKRLLELVRGK